MKMVLLYGFNVLNWSGLNQLIGLFFFVSASFHKEKNPKESSCIPSNHQKTFM